MLFVSTSLLACVLFFFLHFILIFPVFRAFWCFVSDKCQPLLAWFYFLGVLVQGQEVKRLVSLNSWWMLVSKNSFLFPSPCQQLLFAIYSALPVQVKSISTLLSQQMSGTFILYCFESGYLPQYKIKQAKKKVSTVSVMVTCWSYTWAYRNALCQEETPAFTFFFLLLSYRPLFIKR